MSDAFYSNPLYEAVSKWKLKNGDTSIVSINDSREFLKENEDCIGEKKPQKIAKK